LLASVELPENTNQTDFFRRLIESNQKPDYSMTRSTNSHSSKTLSLIARIEALLFIAPSTVPISQLAAALETSEKAVENCLEELKQQYIERGIRLQHYRERVQLVSAPEAALDVERFLGLEAATSLSQAALEAMAIVAYQQPVTRPEVDSIRGVNSDSVLRTLLRKGLIQETGRAPGPGRPILYSITPDFLGYFGLISVEELPPLDLEPVVNDDGAVNDEAFKE
jgi:segregation and condensation protein B